MERSALNLHEDGRFIYAYMHILCMFNVSKCICMCICMYMLTWRYKPTRTFVSMSLLKNATIFGQLMMKSRFPDRKTVYSTTSQGFIVREHNRIGFCVTFMGTILHPDFIVYIRFVKPRNVKGKQV